MVRAAERTGRPARASVWLEDRARRGGSARGGQPSGLDRDRVIETAVRLLDAEGLAKFSMRRLAAELNVTAMSVYWYVDTKDDLLELALDLVFGEMRGPDADGPHSDADGPRSDADGPRSDADGPDSVGDWRDHLRQLAVAYRSALVRHPWVSPLAGSFLNIGPNALDFSRAIQGVVRRTGLSPAEQAGAIAAVFQFVYGFGTIEGHYLERCAAAGVSPDEYFRQSMAAVTEAPQISDVIEASRELIEARGAGTVAEMWERDFTTGLEIQIAGIEAMVARARRDGA
ncbi:TetR/AcrR family transcriptional regulator [Streptomyces cavernae]|uniref:TetR/AcrR family transcriptional regulator n=1 Tax=Streptomyces cavernae TaxID=2259034 RepID=UPI000FEB8B9A|nr:TetR/AcrR family transcriptional regulator C-terminal domain-containing protein [Streptomyces cavernae]